MLSRPIVDKQTQTVTTREFRFAVCSMQGWRKQMEDAHTLRYEMLGDRSKALVGVFDGHNGAEMAELVAERLPSTLSSTLAFRKGKYAQSMAHAFCAVEDILSKKAAHVEAGTTGNAVLMTTSKIVCANTGDSRSCISRGGEAIPLSKDHRPTDASEHSRITRNGGCVDDGRVGGMLAVSRAFGDFEMKPRLPKRGGILSTMLHIASSPSSAAGVDIAQLMREAAKRPPSAPMNRNNNNNASSSASQVQTALLLGGEDDLDMQSTQNQTSADATQNSGVASGGGDESGFFGDSQNDDNNQTPAAAAASSTVMIGGGGEQQQQDNVEEEATMINFDEPGFESQPASMHASSAFASSAGSHRSNQQHHPTATTASSIVPPPAAAALLSGSMGNETSASTTKAPAIINASELLFPMSSFQAMLGASQLTAIPDVLEVDWQPEDEFVVIACDGVWDMYSCQEVVQMIRPAVLAGGG